MTIPEETWRESAKRLEQEILEHVCNAVYVKNFGTELVDGVFTHVAKDQADIISSNYMNEARIAGERLIRYRSAY